MTNTAIAFIAFYIVMQILEWSEVKELDKKCPKDTDPKDKSEKPNNLNVWDSELLKFVGITKPVEGCEIEEVALVDAPLVWQVVKYNESKTKHIVLDISNDIILEIGQ